MENKFFERPTVYVGEVSINVVNLENSLDFYQNIMGFAILDRADGKVRLTANGKTPLLTLEQPENVKPKEERTTGLFHFAILLPTRADLSAFLKHILETEHRYGLGASDHYVSEALYLSDPDGNGIEVYRDRLSSEWNWDGDKVEMATVQLDAEGLLAESNEPWSGLPSRTVMGHIHLHVSDLDSTERFYVDGLAFDIVTRYPGALFASTGGYHHHIGLNVWNGVGANPPAENSVGLNWFTLVYPNEETRSEAVNRLVQSGVTVTQESDFYVAKDPSSNVIRMVLPK
ncbi:catechol 2,3-dioxygenase [Salirhabdus euzebyi]|uniref:Catechol 2,3-dioxygenase n=1 Tax=Salirhabdus euzebyi TaxID=394506 RepID=A0A841Q6N2_9BACI|nr:VOC family protein [Salirhabdus euzebyi]MBB6454013.1 catechol 2,3-dioxygenase [Salirhabdus euzebyi]